MGFKFTTYPTFDSVEMMASNHAHGSVSEIVSEIQDWQTFQFTFQADSAYTYFHLGCFFEDAEVNTDLLQLGNVFFSYYFVDDVWIEEVPLSVHQEDEFSFAVYPNPVKDEFVIDTSRKNLIRHVTLYDVLGNTVMKSSGNAAEPYRVDHLPDGVYIVVMDLEGLSPKVCKILKQ